ncbi:phenylacrylic acid decarboxylase [Mollisiaceae sp. DMI_Dod_QoI]|nr:phenylacrylic acid decarboxylase [Helotiales sp. DMI_Dod_QoI]
MPSEDPGTLHTAAPAVNAERTNGMLEATSTDSSITVVARRRKRIVIGMTGATGAILGIRLLTVLRRLNVETHLVISHWAEATIRYETDYTPANVRALADHVHSNRDQAAPISSGSFQADGMIILPCSMKTLAAVHAGYGDDLISRAADVMLKERRRLVLAIRETPLNEIHLKNMLGVTRAGAIICPTVPAFYTKPASIDDIIDQMVGRLLDLFDIDTGDFQRWSGIHKE